MIAERRDQVFVAFSADHPGEVLAIPLEPNQGVDVVGSTSFSLPQERRLSMA